MTTAEALTQLFNDNFVAYFRSHAAHVNVTGRNFRSDHKLLEGVYTRRQDQIDTIGELLRTLQEFMPCDIYGIIDASNLPTTPIEGTATELLTLVQSDLEHLRDCFIELEDIADEEDHEEIANYCQDQILDLNKSIWMLSVTLE
jgi:DNA-binding ferritin-like protein|tara:strand:- start:270 stop:701 length:432 start_codon:yes stop_codon:yes gene_type:complete